jgi:hypothetical protein
MKKYILSILIIFTFGQLLIGQVNKSENAVIFFNPQYLFTSGLRVDIDFRKPNSNKWWVISPYYYSDGDDASFLNRDNSSGYNSREYESMYGLGLGVARKIFFKSDDTTAKGFYVLGGVTYRYFEIQGDNLTYVETTGADGLEYFDLQDIEYTVNINSYNGYVILGNQFNISSRCYFDLYMGFGLRYSTHNSPENAVVEYNRGNIDYGYSGTQFIGGFRIGVTLF